MIFFTGAMSHPGHGTENLGAKTGVSRLGYQGPLWTDGPRSVIDKSELPKGAPSMNKPRLFQFWDQDPPPDEVVHLLETWEQDPDFIYQRFNTASAHAYIHAHLGGQASTAFGKCAVPAMQADLFRYAALLIEGGLYLDADTSRKGSFGPRLASTDRGLLMHRNGGFANSVIFVRLPCDPMIAKTLDIALTNIRTQSSNNVWEVTGPGIMRNLHKGTDTNALFNGFDVVPQYDLRTVVGFHRDLTYKSSKADWRYNLHFPELNLSIYHKE